MYKADVLADALYEDLISYNEYSMLISKKGPIDLTPYQPSVKLTQMDTLRYYILLIKTESYSDTEHLLNILRSTYVYDEYNDVFDSPPNTNLSQNSSKMYRTCASYLHKLREYFAMS
jgi:hypothetical protein